MTGEDPLSPALVVQMWCNRESFTGSTMSGEGIGCFFEGPVGGSVVAWIALAMRTVAMAVGETGTLR
jgi:hypothetical protein